jgi:sporadic carbohydrate cluster 2OG-Fe(II) oxygenase
MLNLSDQFTEKGWIVMDFVDPSPVFLARQELEKQLKGLLNRPIRLEDYHQVVEDDKTHTAWQVEITQFFRQQKFARKIIQSQAELFKQLVGADLLVQANPYLRMTRPFKKQDNIGYHRDTFYGGSPYELSILIPFVDLEGESSLSVLSGSHVLSEELFPTVQVQNPDGEVVKGSEKHNLGFLYAPKVMDPSIEERMQAIPLKVGQALVFSLSTVHGSIENRGAVTRWSSDVRVVNALAPVDLSARPDYYEPLCSSPVTACARQYIQANAGATTSPLAMSR